MKLKFFGTLLTVAIAALALAGCGGQVTENPPTGEEVSAVSIEFGSGITRDASSLVNKMQIGEATAGFEPGQISATAESLDMICKIYINTTDDAEAIIDVRDLTAEVPDAPCNGATNCIECSNFWRTKNALDEWVDVDPMAPGAVLNNCVERCSGLVAKSQQNELTGIAGHIDFWTHVNADITDLGRAAILQEGFTGGFVVDPITALGQLDLTDVLLNALGASYMVDVGDAGAQFDISIDDPFVANSLASPAAAYDGDHYVAALSISDSVPADATALGDFTFHTVIPVPGIKLTGVMAGDISVAVDPPMTMVSVWCADVADCAPVESVMSIQSSLFKDATVVGGGDLSLNASSSVKASLDAYLGLATIESINSSAKDLSTGDTIIANSYVSEVDSSIFYVVVQDAYLSETHDIVVSSSVTDSDNNLYNGSVSVSLGYSLSHGFEVDQSTHWNYNPNEMLNMTTGDLTYDVNDFLVIAPTEDCDTMAEVVSTTNGAARSVTDIGASQQLFNDSQKTVDTQMAVNLSQQVDDASWEAWEISANIYSNGLDNVTVNSVNPWDLNGILVAYCSHVAGTGIATPRETQCEVCGKTALEGRAGPVTALAGFTTRSYDMDGQGNFRTDLLGGSFVPIADQTTTPVRIISGDMGGTRCEYEVSQGVWQDIATASNSEALDSEQGKEMVSVSWDTMAPVFGFTQIIYSTSSTTAPGVFNAVLYGPYRNIGFSPTADPSSGFMDAPDERIYQLLENVTFNEQPAM